MSILQYIIGAVIFVLAIVLVVFISMQQGKRKGLENVISGNSSSNSYLNKTEAAKKGKKFERWTIILAVVFAVLVILLYILTSVDTNKKNNASDTSSDAAVSQTVSTGTTSTPASTGTNSAPATSTPAEETSAQAG